MAFSSEASHLSYVLDALRAGRALLIKNLQRRAAFQAARRYME